MSLHTPESAAQHVVATSPRWPLPVGAMQRCSAFALAAIVLTSVACGGSDDEETTTDGAGATGGASGASGGTTAGSGGTSKGGSAGATAGKGGASAGSGGTAAGAGGASAGSGGASAGSGGASAGNGGASAGNGGASAGSGGNTAGAGGSAPAVDYVAYVTGSPDYSPTVRKIEAFSFDVGTGAMKSLGTWDAGPLPTYLAFHPSGSAVYTTNESGSGHVRAFGIEKGSGKLAALSDRTTGGNGAVHVFARPQGDWLLVSNYDGGNISTFPIDAKGDVGPAKDTKPTGTQSHQVVTDPAGKFVFAPCRSANLVAGFTLGADGTLTPLSPKSLALSGGPRHMAFHPSAKYAYVLAEDSGKLTSFAYDAQTGALTAPEQAGTVQGETAAAHVAVRPDGKLLFASARSTKSLVSYTIDAATGRPTLTETLGNVGTVRDFHVESTGKYLLAANQDGNTVTVYEIGPSGKLTAKGPPVTTVPGPQSVIVVPVPKPLRLPSPTGRGAGGEGARRAEQQLIPANSS